MKFQNSDDDEHNENERKDKVATENYNNNKTRIRLPREQRNKKKKCPCDFTSFWTPIKNKLEDWMPWCPCFQQESDSNIDEPPPKRYLYVGSSFDNNEHIKMPHLQNEEESEFCSNYISTTKYTMFTFLPINLFEQFQKKANAYFLIIGVLSFTDLSPKSPVFSIAPLTFVLAVSAVKEAFEDYKRYQMDQEINNRKVEIYRPDNNGKNWRFQEIAWQYVEVGDILKITRKSPAFPADLLLLQSSTNQGLCNIETANLDGETNLKIKQAAGATYEIATNENGNSYPNNSKLDFKLESEAPNEKMDKSSWKGALYFSNDPENPIAVGMNQLLLRGCTLRNTDWIIGLCVFTGIETKLMLNNKLQTFKRSNVDLIVDKALYIIFIAQGLLCAFGAIAHYIWLISNADEQWYQYIDSNGNDKRNYGYQAFEAIFTFLVLLDLFVPISLYVSMELVKFTQAWLINQDDSMICKSYEGETIKAKARTSNLNEELGQVSFIFSDKTGTLTQNIMEFMKAHVDGVRYGPGEMEKQHDYIDRIEVPKDMPEFDPHCQFTDNRLAHRRSNPIINEFLTLLAVCHSIIPEYPEEKGEVVYQASSPDEKALVMFAKNLHYFFYDSHVQILEHNGRKIDGHRFYVNIFGEESIFDIYHMLEFSSSRKRMSVIVKDPRDNKFKLYCKGADNVIYSRLTQDQKDGPWGSTLESLKYFAADGLRTLCCGMKVLTEDEYSIWLNKLFKAKAAIENRDELVDECCNEIEKDFTLLGATAIEDKLQDGVPDTIANLAVAGISIWVLTGDKVETAINIGRSCRLLTPKMIREDNTLYVIDPDEKLSDEEGRDVTLKLFDDAAEKLEHCEQNDKNQALVISGKALGYVFPHRKRDGKGREIPPTPEQEKDEQEMQEKVLNICRKCRAVICCRVSPKQKSQMVQLVRQNIENIITLAIGDGANDVPMIKAAHVGIGISGQEGLQAVMASDYAIGQFRFLQDLLLIHGAWDYRRISILILYSFYKNIMFSTTQMWFAFFCGFSGTLYYDAFSGSCYNLIFTAFPVLLTAILDRPYSKTIAKLCPELYENGPNNKSFNLKIFLFYCLEGACHSCIIFFFPTFIMSFLVLPDGQTVGFWVSNTTMFTILVLTATIKMMIETKTWVIINQIFFALSILSWFVFALAWNSFPLSWGFGNDDVYYVSQRTFGIMQFWFTIMCTPIICLFPELIFRYVIRMYVAPTPLHVIEELEHVYPTKCEKFINSMETHLQRQQQKDPKDDEKINTLQSQGFLGFAEFHLDPSHPDYVMPEEEYMSAVHPVSRKKRNKLRKMLDKAKSLKNRDKTEKSVTKNKSKDNGGDDRDDRDDTKDKATLI